MRNDVGSRLKQIRADRKQPEMAEFLGLAHRTYAGYERGEAEIGAAPLAKLVEAGWNANWLLTGEGPERSSQLQVAESQAESGSQPVSRDDLTIALQLVSEVVTKHQLPMSPEKQAELTIAVAELHAEGVPESKLLRFVLAAVA